MRRTSGCEASGDPTSGPVPVTTLNRPSGSPASVITFASSSEPVDVNSEGFRITALPAASAGAPPRQAWFIGKFHGVITATTPYGS